MAVTNLSSSPSINAPPAFCCTLTGGLMRSPGVNLCAHLFDRTAVGGECPVDGHTVDKTTWVALPNLQSHIYQWAEAAGFTSPQPANVDPQSKRSYSQVTTSGPSTKTSCSRGLSSSPREKQEEAQEKNSASLLQKKGNGKCTLQISNAHTDDVHTIIRLSSGNFATGSKDGSLKVWNLDGNCIHEEGRPENGYQYWVTAMAPYQDGQFVCGTRDGYIAHFYDSGELISNFEYRPPKSNKRYISKDRNQNRINCINPIQSGRSDGGCYFGTPCFFHTFKDGKRQNYTRTSQNDWVYCVEGLPNGNLLVVTGDILHVYQPPPRNSRRGYWTEFTRIIDPQRETYGTYARSRNSKGRQRAHISSMDVVDSQNSIHVTVDFIGQMRIVDVFKEQVLNTVQAHRGRGWTVRTVNQNVIASSGDDRKMLLWDRRDLSRPCATFDKHPGRVSVLLPIVGTTTIISASCPDKLRANQDRAVLSFWDIRMVYEE